MSRAEQIASNLDEVRRRMQSALAVAGRAPDSVRLLAVSKTVAPEDIFAALQAGQTDFAENYGQEFRDKHTSVADWVAANKPSLTPHWHFIGPLQTNKVKYVAGKVDLVHTVCSLDVLAEIERKASASPTPQHCLVQVNVAGETQKSGLPPAHLPAMLDAFAGYAHVHCDGLMVIPPYNPNPELSRPHFAALRKLLEQQRGTARPNVTLTQLSMGMSHDLEVAIAEGATLIRVGTAIFGERG